MEVVGQRLLLLGLLLLVLLLLGLLEVGVADNAFAVRRDWKLKEARVK